MSEATVDVEAIHLWFSLTYANYLVVPRSVLQSMPDEWQARFTAALREMDDAFGHLDWPSYNVRALRRDAEHRLIAPDCDECDGTGLVTVDDVNEGCARCHGEGEIESDAEYRYETAEEVGFRTDPIPHYNRGRTRITPRVGNPYPESV